MSRKHFSVLFFLTFIIAVAALMIPGESGRQGSLERSVFVPQLKDRVNDVDWLRVTVGGNRIVATMHRVEDRWVVEEAASYSADWTVIRNFLSELSQARVVEVKTANPDYYDRLGVEDVTAGNAGSVMVEFGESTGLPAIIFGKAARGREGQYARLQGMAESVLIDRSLDPPVDTSGWLDRDIVDIADSTVIEFEIRHADGARVAARKASAEQEDFSLDEVPAGREPSSAWTVNTLANSLSSLAFESVSRAEQVDWTGATEFRLLTVDGLQVVTRLVEVPIPAADETEAGALEYWIRLEAGVFTTALENGVDAENAVEAEAQAAAINHKVNGWAYRIPKYKFDTMNKRMTDLLRDAENS